MSDASDTPAPNGPDTDDQISDRPSRPDRSGLERTHTRTRIRTQTRRIISGPPRWFLGLLRAATTEHRNPSGSGSKLQQLLTRGALGMAGIMAIAQPVYAQSALEEASGVACDGTLGSGIFLGLGLLALALALVGVGQIAWGFFKTSPGGGMGSQSAGRGGIMNGVLTLSGALFLGAVGSLLSYLGVDLGSCIEGDIITVAPNAFDLVLAVI